jgi:hypothetical protein
MGRQDKLISDVNSLLKHEKEEVRTIAQSILTILHQTGTVYVNLSKKQVGLKISIRTIDTELKLILNELKSLINEI